MTIVVLDSHTLNPGDLDWGPLRSLGTCRIYDRTAREDILRRSSEADVLLTNKTPVTRSVIAGCPQLRYIGVLATGYNIVDIEAARERGIPVCNVPTYGTLSVAQMTLAHLLHFTLHVADHAASTRRGEWSRSQDFCYWRFPLIEVAHLTLGVVGYGRIGQATARAAAALGMKILAFDPEVEKLPDGLAEAVPLDELFGRSDVVSLHCPLTALTSGIVSRERLGLMKPTAFLINTSRGGLIDEQALADALNAGRIAGAGLDVLTAEPPPEDHVLLQARNCFVTPHIAWATRAARERLLRAVVDNIRAFMSGNPTNVVN